MAARVFDMVIQHSALWKMVDMNAPLTNLEKLSSASRNIPLLEELYVSTTRKAHFSTDALSSAPSLRRADFEKTRISQLPLNAGLLTHFSGTFSSFGGHSVHRSDTNTRRNSDYDF